MDAISDNQAALPLLYGIVSSSCCLREESGIER